nr:hypothetical protein [Candidatus Sigynarchaeota archaeon]
MPSIAHLFLGGMVGYSLHVISDKRFSKYHVMILMIANYLGPDLGWVLGIGDFTHTYVGIIFFDIFLAFFYSYFTRFSPDFKRKILVDNGYNKVPYMNAFFLACAGGIMHVYLDGVMNHQGDFHLFPGFGTLDEFVMSINDFFTFWYEPLVPANTIAALLVGMSFVMGFIMFFLHALKTMDARFALKIAAFVAAFMVLYYLVGYLTTLQAEGGAILYVTLFWIVPFGLCAVAMKYPSPKTSIAVRARVKQHFIPLLLVLDLVFGAIFLVAGIAFIVLVDDLLPILLGSWAPLSSHATSLHALIIFIGITFIIIGGWNAFEFAWYKKHENASVNTIVAAGLVFIGGVLSLVLCGVAFTSGGAIVDIIFTMYDAGEIITPGGLLALLLSLGIVFVILAGFSFVAGAGIMMERHKITRVAFVVNAIFAWTIFGLYICCLLSQETQEHPHVTGKHETTVSKTS